MGRKLYSTLFFSALVAMTARYAQAEQPTPKYEASSVRVSVMCPVWNGQEEHIYYYQLLGVSDDGYQIWGRRGDQEGSNEARWRIDDGPKISHFIYSFRSNTLYDLDEDYTTIINRDPKCSLIAVTDDHDHSDYKYSHLLKVKSKTSAQFFGYEHGTNYALKEFAVSSHINLKKESVTYDVENKKYRVKLSWNLDNVSYYTVDKVTFYAQMEGIESPQAIDVIFKSDGIVNFEIPWNIKNVTFSAKFTPNNNYKLIFQKEVTSDTIRQEFLINDLPCSIKAADLSNSYDADYGTYNPEVEWTCPEGYENIIDKVNIDYSVDNGKTWKHGLTTNTGAGTGKLHNILPGYSKYIFRYNGAADSWKQAGDAININAYDTIQMSYKPQINSLTLAGNLTDNLDEQKGTFKPSIAYSLNRDLYEMSADKATLEYSVNGGAYKTGATFFADENGTQPITIEANGKAYQFRLTVSAISEGKIVKFVEESPVYQRFMGVDDIAADDNTPVDVYTLDGKLIAKQILPADAKTRLANGTYIVGGKKLVIDK